MAVTSFAIQMTLEALQQQHEQNNAIKSSAGLHVAAVEWVTHLHNNRYLQLGLTKLSWDDLNVSLVQKTISILQQNQPLVWFIIQTLSSPKKCKNVVATCIYCPIEYIRYIFELN